jgi:hypothetical protein
MHLFNKLFKIFNVNIDLRQLWDDWPLDEIIYNKLLFVQIILQLIELLWFAIIFLLHFLSISFYLFLSLIL